MINSEVSQALVCALWISERCSECLPAEIGNSVLGSIQLALDIDEESTYEKLIVGLGIEFGHQLCTWLIKVELYESANKTATVINKIEYEHR